MVLQDEDPIAQQDHQVHEQDEHKSVFSSFGWAEEAQENEIHQEGGLIGPSIVPPLCHLQELCSQPQHSLTPKVFWA